jgi:ComF family protein
MSFTAALGGLLAMVAPRRCPGCDVVVDETGPAFCGACEPLLERATGALGTYAAFLYGGPLADAVRRYKYGARTELAVPLGDRLASEARTRFGGTIDVVLPVPPHPRRLAERGFDPTALLAIRVARALGARYAPRAIVRTRDTPPQASLARAQRSGNVAGCFTVRSSLDERRVLIVDDVRTTGATLFEMARTADDAGAISIALFALAAADPDDAR